MIDKTKGIIISYPRSGLNWTRYCIEYFSGKRTPGRTKLVLDGEIAVYRTHNVEKNKGPDSCFCRFQDKTGNPLHERVVLLLRDYKETFVRSKRFAFDERGMAAEWLIRRLKAGKVKSFRHFFENVRAFDAFDGPKLLVKYEDLVSDFKTMLSILDFLEIPHNCDGFDLEEHRARSIGIYDKQHRSFTKKDVQNFSFHRDHVDPGFLELLERTARRDHPDIYGKYLE